MTDGSGIEPIRRAFDDGFRACAGHYVNDPDTANLAAMVAEAWGDYAETQLGICGTPPVGWYCTRDPGHVGPCAALPAPEENVMTQTDGRLK